MNNTFVISDLAITIPSFCDCGGKYIRNCIRKHESRFCSIACIRRSSKCTNKAEIAEVNMELRCKIIL